MLVSLSVFCLLIPSLFACGRSLCFVACLLSCLLVCLPLCLCFVGCRPYVVRADVRACAHMLADASARGLMGFSARRHIHEGSGLGVCLFVKFRLAAPGHEHRGLAAHARAGLLTFRSPSCQGSDPKKPFVRLSPKVRRQSCYRLELGCLSSTASWPHAANMVASSIWSLSMFFV